MSNILLPENLGSDNPQEFDLIAKKREDTKRALQKYREPDFDHLADKEARMGHPMLHTDLIRLVRNLTTKVWPEQSLSNAGVMGFYTVRDGVKTHVCAFDKGWLPEHTYIELDERGLPIESLSAMKRGWREVLGILLRHKLITRKQHDSVFGHVSTSEMGHRWHKLFNHLS